MRRTPEAKRLTLSIAVIMTVHFICGCGEQPLESRWLDRAIAIDGSDSEWRGCEAYNETDNGVTVAVFNDERNLYVCLSCWDRRTQMQILMRGLTVWFDSGGGTAESFGISYPLKKMTLGADTPRSGFPREVSRNIPTVIDSLLDESRGDMEVIGPQEHARLSGSVDNFGKLGIEAMIGMADRILVYELKVPLATNDAAQYSVGARPGSTIGVGFTSGKQGMTGQSGFHAGPMPGGRGGGDVGHPPGMRGRGGTGSPPGTEGPPGTGFTQPIEPLEVWTKFRLATATSGEPQG